MSRFLGATVVLLSCAALACSAHSKSAHQKHSAHAAARYLLLAYIFYKQCSASGDCALTLERISSTILADGNTGLSGKALAKCDRSTVSDPKYPTTGWKRTDYCSAEDSDHGSHFVCVNMPSDFWVKTGQASSITDAQENWPKPGPWCICMWAYASYLSKEPSFADDVICDATNEWVLDKYDKSVATQCAALMSLCKKCGLKSAVCPTDC